MSMPAERFQSDMTLEALLRGITPAPAIAVSGIRADSRRLQPGEVFLACQGATSHGLDYLADAVAADVAAVVWDSATGTAPDCSVPMIAVDGLANHIGEIANRWFNNPSLAVKVTGVTGTNGKTTVAFLVSRALGLLNKPCGYIGTLGYGIEQLRDEGGMTTPPSIELHRILAEFRDAGAASAAIEVSSHALDQARVDGVHFDSAIFTNLSRDHIDYHGSMSAYFASKASLFLDRDIANRIVNIDSEYGAQLAELCGSNVVTVSTEANRVANGRPFVFIRGVVAHSTGSRISFRSSWGSGEFVLPLPGAFNVANAAAVLALLLCNGVTLEDAVDALQRVCAPPGRMELVSVAGDMRLPAVYVDYSHTPASLEAALQALRLHCSGKLWCVFGCGGDRDRGKRAMMGTVAEQLADCTIVTSDNPRSEPPKNIIADIVQGMSKDVITMVDRGEAIAYAVARADPGDVILVAGKGHEDYQIIGAETLAFSDQQVARNCLNQRSVARS